MSSLTAARSSSRRKVASEKAQLSADQQTAAKAPRGSGRKKRPDAQMPFSFGGASFSGVLAPDDVSHDGQSGVGVEGNARGNLASATSRSESEDSGADGGGGVGVEEDVRAGAGGDVAGTEAADDASSAGKGVDPSPKRRKKDVLKKKKTRKAAKTRHVDLTDEDEEGDGDLSGWSDREGKTGEGSGDLSC